MTCVSVHVCVTDQPSAVLSNLAEHLKQGRDGMHAVEKVQRNGKIENCGPYAEAKRLLLQTVVVLWSTAKGRKDPQLKKTNRLFIGKLVKIWTVFLHQGNSNSACCYAAIHQDLMNFPLDMQMFLERC